MTIKSFDKRTILKYAGNASQLFGVKDYTLNGGKATGTRAVDFRNGSGLEFTVIADRAMDISNLSFKGINLSYITKAGVVAPQFYEAKDIGFLRSFTAGFLTTCGLSNVGSPCVDDGEEYGQHGRISNTPAEEFHAGTEWTEDGPVLKVSGLMREGRLFGENLELRREIVCKCGENKFTIHDTVENNGFRDEPLMLLYHFNLGYPLLSENARFETPAQRVVPRDEEAAGGLAECNRFQEPTPAYKEQVFYHELKTDGDGKTYAALVNPDLDLALVIRVKKAQLPNLTQWKQMGEGEYVLGIEPCNCHVSGRVAERAAGTLEYLKPGEIRHFDIEVEILEGLPAHGGQILFPEF